MAGKQTDSYQGTPALVAMKYSSPSSRSEHLVGAAVQRWAEDIPSEEGSHGAGTGGQNCLITARRKAEGWVNHMNSGYGEWRNNSSKTDEYPV